MLIAIVRTRLLIKVFGGVKRLFDSGQARDRKAQLGIECVYLCVLIDRYRFKFSIISLLEEALIGILFVARGAMV